MITEQDISQLNTEFAAAGPETILQWASETLQPDVAASSSFQTQGVPLLHMISRRAPSLPVIFVDTGYHFPETLVFRDQLVSEWKLNLRVVHAAMPRHEFARQYGELFRRDPDQCCYINKVEPMRRAIAGLQGWISGIRRDESPARAGIRIIERTPQGVLRIHPLANWTKRDVWQYVHDHHLPEHPLLAQGYLSIGCAPCTLPALLGDDERSGRWADHNKSECGLHTLLRESTDSPVAFPANSAQERGTP
jgi:phosphoadenosine phosphosulfate reductase